MELYERIRQENRKEGLGIRALAARHHVHRRTVREPLASALPPPRKVPEREVSAGLGQMSSTRTRSVSIALGRVELRL